MTQALCVKDGSLPQDLMVQNAYTKLCSGSKIITVVMRNSNCISPDIEKEDLSGLYSCSYSDTRTPHADV